MSISGLVLTTDGNREHERSLREQLGADSRFDIGAPSGVRFPMTLETSSRREMRAALDTLKELPGVVGVTLAFAYYDDESANHLKTHNGHLPHEVSAS